MHILNLLMDTVYLSTSVYSALCFYEMDYYYSVWTVLSEVNILRSLLEGVLIIPVSYERVGFYIHCYIIMTLECDWNGIWMQ